MKQYLERQFECSQSAIDAFMEEVKQNLGNVPQFAEKSESFYQLIEMLECELIMINNKYQSKIQSAYSEKSDMIEKEHHRTKCLNQKIQRSSEKVDLTVERKLSIQLC